MKSTRFTSAFPVVLFLVALFLAALPAGAQITQPQLGYVLDSGGELRPVFGVAASATLGDPALPNAISFACSAKLCLATTDGAVVAFQPGVPGGGQGAGVSRPVVAAPCVPCAGPATIALDDFGVDHPSAWVYFQAARQLARWHDGVLDMVDFAPGGEILSLRATVDGFDYAVARDSLGRRALRPSAVVVWIEHYSASDGSTSVLDSVTIDSTTAPSLGAPEAVMLFDGGVLASSTDQVALRRPDGQELTFPLTGPKTFYAAGNGYVEIGARDGLWILRTDAGREQLALLPGVLTRATQGAIQGDTPGTVQGALR